MKNLPLKQQRGWLVQKKKRERNNRATSAREREV